MSTADSDSLDHDVRADGPTVVRKGPMTGPVVVVVDPQGDAKHDELPATWRGLTEDVGVVWWRLPAGDVPPAELTDDHGPAVHLVGARDTALLVLSLAARLPGTVRSVVLVDPPWDADMPALTRVVPVPVHHVVTGGSEQAVDWLPLGHPDVVVAVLEALMSADLWPDSDVEPRVPGAESLMVEAWQATRTRLADLLRSLRPTV